MEIKSKVLSFQTEKELDFIDFTDKIKNFIKESQIQNGLVNVQTLHTTCPVFLNENEPLLLEDFKNYLQKLSPKDSDYRHNDFRRRTVNICKNECENGHSHCRALNLPSNLTLNLIGGQIQLGQWQRIFLVELDRPRPRKIQIQVIGG